MHTRFLYLDFDGVLHPDEVYITKHREPELDWAGSLFMWESRLLAELVEHPDVQVILSTNWVSHFGLARTAGYPCEGLRSRVIGTSTPERRRRPREYWSRAQEVEQHVRKHKPDDWIIVDDDRWCEWSEAPRHRLVLCESNKALVTKRHSSSCACFLSVALGDRRAHDHRSQTARPGVRALARWPG